MNIDLKDMLNISTNYNFKKYRNDILIQEENTHNIVTNGLLKTAYTFNDYWGAGMSSLVLGSGTTEPAVTDKALNARLWNSFSASSRTFSNDDTSITMIQSYVIPAESTYVGNITECGLCSSGDYSNLKTRALIRDAEGNPIAIEKTDIDKLIVTVSVTFIFTTPEGVYLIPLDKSPMYYGLKAVAAPLPIQPVRTLAAYLSQDYQEVMQNGVNAYAHADSANKQGVNYTAGCSNGILIPDKSSSTIPTVGQKKFTGRLSVNKLKSYETYVKAIIFMGVFIIPLPNENYFPTYEMTDISIGVGDGITTQFNNPLNYFKKDTEKIYKNGVQLIKDVDYTIDYRHNNDGMPELFASADAIITGGTRIKNDPYPPIFRPAAFPQRTSYSVAIDSWTHCYRIDSFNTNNPLFFDCKKEEDINYLRIGTKHNNNLYTLYYSTDGINYIEAISFTKTSSLNEVTFETITARYWKLTIGDGSSNISSGATVTNYNNENNKSDAIKESYSSLTHPELYCSLGYKGDPYITFTEAPAQDDVITMDVSMDLPFKNANNVIDYDFTISLF